jgi:2-polyprenyl-6-methoxyphenol hydroxylase-like FAD-dependent oxidoreductase
VLIVGGGPVGLTLALDLGRRGVRCTLLEQKNEPQFLPKMERCNARTMEIYRRLGIAKRIRAAGFPRSVPMDVFIVTSLTEPPLVHLPYPSVAEAEATIAAANDGTQPLEPYQLISQYTLEPLLKAEIERIPHVSVRYGCEFLSFRQDARSVTAKVRTSSGEVEELGASYLVGCDGGSSTVRKQLGINLRGEGNLLELRQALFRAPDLFERITIGKGRHYHVADSRATFLIVQDDTRHFSLHSVVDSDEDMPRMLEKTANMPVDYETLYVGRWKQNLLLADRYQEGRVFLAGDAVHLVIPTGGLGMNTGVGDAIDLSWKLAATLAGWGGPQLLASYETERRQVGERNVAASRFASMGRRAWRAAYRPEVREPGPAGDAARRDFAAFAEPEQRKSNEMIGAELGYRYDGSPLIWHEEGEPPEFDPLVYRPSTWPGTRLPHAWLASGEAVQDLLPPDYALLKVGPTRSDPGALAAAFAERSVPLRIVEADDDVVRAIYGRSLLLLRPDMHVSWRGDELPANISDLVAIVSGHGASAKVRSPQRNSQFVPIR